jgi:hypothetical protein
MSDRPKIEPPEFKHQPGHSPKGETIEIKNNGQEIVGTNYWRLPEEDAGKFYVSINADAFRLLVPTSYEEKFLPEVTKANKAIISRGPWPEQDREDGIEILFENETASPFFMHLSVDCFDRLPTKSDSGRTFVLSIWTKEGGKVREMSARFRMVPRIPCFEPWKVTN